MKKGFFFMGIFLSALLVFLIVGCEGPAGPQGPAGKDAGFTYFENFKENLDCGMCHTPGLDTVYYVAGRVYEWQNSFHATGGDLERNGPSCAGCHTTEGAIQMMSGSAVTAQLHPSPPGCFACHSPHQRGDFSLRSTTPVTLASSMVGVPDATFDYGKGNQCVQCHKPRGLSTSAKPDPTKTATTDTIKITNNRWYAHYGVQGQMLMGEGGFEFQGYTYTGNSSHSGSSVIRQEGCVICHMAEQSYSPNLGTGTAGGHTMHMQYEEGGEEEDLVTGCNISNCHGSAALGEFDERQSVKDAIANTDTLKSLLVARGWIDTASTIQSPLTIVPASRSGALFNYMLVYHDASKGVHNTKYTNELLRSSIEELRKP